MRLSCERPLGLRTGLQGAEHSLLQLMRGEQPAEFAEQMAPVNVALKTGAGEVAHQRRRVLHELSYGGRLEQPIDGQNCAVREPFDCKALEQGLSAHHRRVEQPLSGCKADERAHKVTRHIRSVADKPRRGSDKLHATGCPRPRW